MVPYVRHVVPSQVVPEGVGEWLEEAGVAGGGGRGWGCGPSALVGIQRPAVGAVGHALCSPQGQSACLGSHSPYTYGVPVGVRVGDRGGSI